MKNRRGELTIKPGYDGVYGVPVIDGREVKIESDDGEKPERKDTKADEVKKEQKGLGDYF